MSDSESCIFCRIGRGEIATSVVFEDDRVVAFDDIMPQAPVHVLVVPRDHYADLGDSVPVDLAGHVFSTVVPRVARIKGMSDSGYRAIVNNGPDAGQTVHHLHVHVLGGRPMSHGMVRFGEDDE